MDGWSQARLRESMHLHIGGSIPDTLKVYGRFSKAIWEFLSQGQPTKAFVSPGTACLSMPTLLRHR